MVPFANLNSQTLLVARAYHQRQSSNTELRLRSSLPFIRWRRDVAERDADSANKGSLYIPSEATRPWDPLSLAYFSRCGWA